MINESHVEDATLEWFRELGYTIAYGPHLAPGEPASERRSFADVVLEQRLRDAIHRLNPAIPADAQQEALRKVLRVTTPSLFQTNRAFYKMLRDGVDVEYQRNDGSIAGDHVRLVDFANIDMNDWLAVNQLTVIEGQNNRRPDIVVFVNGIPLVVVELKNAANEDTTIWSAYKQIKTYQSEIPSLLQYNAVVVISDGLQARIGSLTANQEWYKVWRTVDGASQAPSSALELETLIYGVFQRKRFLEMLEHFIVFEENPDTGTLNKIVAGYHQFYAVNAAVEETVRASDVVGGFIGHEPAGTYWAGRMHGGKPGDRRAGVVWHTQGSGKSLSMLFYAGRIIRERAMQNPTLVMLTDRNDLDDQLFGQFQRCTDILGQTPVQATSRDHLRELLSVASGGVVFTTIQKFGTEDKARMTALSDRRNIIVIADEAHRSQYDLIDGLARNLRDALPHASFIGFTGTPIEKTDANTRAVFGDYISIYDIQRSVEDKSTVPIYYESRISKLSLNEAALPTIDDEFEEITESEEDDSREKLKSQWTALEVLVGDPDRIAKVAEDIVAHYERRSEAMTGKAMIVCMSRRICVDVYNALIALRPDWAGSLNDEIESEKTKKCIVKVVMTGSAEDGPEWQPHIRNKERRRKLATRFKDTRDPFSIVIVRDMWLTGFDAPCLHTMYVDKPMQGHGLMQAIARVNRVFRDKPGGLVVDYLGLADQLRKALATYTESGGKGDQVLDTRGVIAAMQEKYAVASDMLHGFDWSIWEKGTRSERLHLLPPAQEHILEQENGKQRFIKNITDLSRLFALCAASDEATEIRDDVAFFQTVQAALTKRHRDGQQTPEQLDAAIRQLVSKAISADGEIIDIFSAAGLKHPDISILSEEFLVEVRGLKHKNVAAELLEKLLKDEVKKLSTRNLVQSELFSDMLKKAINSYHNRAISSQDVIEELIRIAKEISASEQRVKDLGLTYEEIAFYDALAQNASAIEVMGDAQLRVIATELVTQVRKNATIDWTLRESAQAKMRVMVKRILRKYGYPPDLQDEAVQTVLAQARLLIRELV